MRRLRRPSGTRLLPIADVVEAAGRRQDQRRQGRFVERGARRRPLPVRAGLRRRHADRARRAAAAGPPVPLRPEDRRGRGHDPGRRIRAGSKMAASSTPGSIRGGSRASRPSSTLRAFLFGRLGWNLLGGNLIISGAFGLFRRDYLTEILGYATSTVTEDFELIVRLQRHLKRAEHPGAGGVHSRPGRLDRSADVAGRARPAARTLASRAHRHDGGAPPVLFNANYGATGLVAMPYFLIAELLAPVVEAAGLVITVLCTLTGMLEAEFAFAFFATAYLFGTLLSLSAILMEEVSFKRYRRPADTLRFGLVRVHRAVRLPPDHGVVQVEGVRPLLPGRPYVGPDAARRLRVEPGDAGSGAGGEARPNRLITTRRSAPRGRVTARTRPPVARRRSRRSRAASGA